MRYDIHLAELPEPGTTGEGDLSFAAFSLEHAGCGDEVIEVRVDENTILEWCTACRVMRIFGPDPEAYVLRS